MSEPTKVTQKINRWAIISLLCSLGSILCIFIFQILFLSPLFAIIAIPIAIIAISSIRHNPQQRGKVLAIIALCIGCLLISGYVVGGFWWHANVRSPMLHGPSVELRAGFNNDLAAFKSGFYGDGASATDDEVSLLISNLRLRYGNFVSAVQFQAQDSAAGKENNFLHPQITYIFEFETKQVPALADFLVIDPEQRQFVGKFNWVIIQDDELGDLIYPASAEEAIRNYLESLEQQDNGD